MLKFTIIFHVRTFYNQSLFIAQQFIHPNCGCAIVIFCQMFYLFWFFFFLLIIFYYTENNFNGVFEIFDLRNTYKFSLGSTIK